MAKITYNICVLIVTYGDRWQFLSQVLKRALSFDHVSRVVIIDNASPYSVASACSGLGDDRVVVVTQSENFGSAGGYKIGLEYFKYKTEACFVWLLDDDNLPAADALKNLLDAWDSIEGGEDAKALYSLRLDRKQHLKIAHGEDANRYYVVPNSFMGFNLFRIPFNQYHKLKERFGKPGPLQAKAAMPYVPYGGLFMHKSMIDKIGCPNADFFLYADDSEYSYRITQSGGKIWLIPSSHIEDIDRSFGVVYKHRAWRSIFLDMWTFRTYYQVRNSVYFYSANTVTNRTVYNINRRLFLAGLFLKSLLTSRRENYKKFLRAVNHGLSAKLGIVNPVELE